jgi:hypothetical protein
MMTDIDTMNFVAFGIAHVAIKSTPAKSERTYKEIVEEINVDSHYSTATQPIGPPGHMTQHTDKESRLTTATRTMVSMRDSHSLSTNYAALCHIINKKRKVNNGKL